MANNKPYISLDEELEIDQQSTGIKSTEPSESNNVFTGEIGVEDYLPPTNTSPETTPTTLVTETIASAPATTEISETQSSVSREESTPNSNLSSLEQEMLDVAIKNYNLQRDKAHQEIDQVYDRMIQITENKIRGLTKDVAKEVGM